MVCISYSGANCLMQRSYRHTLSMIWCLMMIYLMLIVWCITAMFGKGYALRSGVGYNNVLESGGIMKYGPAIGTISSYMGAYVYNCDYEDWRPFVIVILVLIPANPGSCHLTAQRPSVSRRPASARVLRRAGEPFQPPQKTRPAPPL